MTQKRLDIGTIAPVVGTLYPSPFDQPCRARQRRKLGDAARLTQFGVNLLILPPGAAHPAVLKHLQAGAPGLGVEVVAVNAATPPAIENGFAEAAQQGAGAVIVTGDAFFSEQGAQIAASALQHRLATISI